MRKPKSYPLVLLLILLSSWLVVAEPPQQQQQPQQLQFRKGGPGLDHAVGPDEAGIKLDPQPMKFGPRKGWKVKLQGGHPLATPAYVKGRVYLGGGFGSHEFYSLNATTGDLVWLYKTADDGPTAAVYADGLLAFNTESCELEVLTLEGKRKWKSWLGDPLMSIPALNDNKVYMAYPQSKGDGQHHLACFEADSGERLWAQPIAGEIITAPVVQNGSVYLTTLEGIVYCFEASSGKQLWKEKKNATSSVAVWNGKLYYSQRDKSQDRQYEGLSQLDSKSRKETRHASTRRQADYLDYSRKKDSSAERASQAQDASVGFATSKGSAKIGQARANLGEGSVYGVWSYQGGRPFFWQGRMYSSLGDELNCVEPESGKVSWKRQFNPKGETLDRTLTPPAIANGKLFVGTSFGELLCLEASSGKTLWKAELKGEVIRFQPIVAKGRVYVPTNSGTLYCIETGDVKDDGWYMWGKNASHTGGADSKQGREPAIRKLTGNELSEILSNAASRILLDASSQGLSQ